MTSNRLCPLVVFLLLPIGAAHAAPIAKQLAGPPAEFAAMRAPDPAAAAIYSKSALLPIAFEPQKSGTSQWRGELPVENGRLRFLLFSGRSDRPWQPALIDPSGSKQSIASIAKAARSTAFGTEQATFPADYFALGGIANGRWTLQLEAPAGAPRDGYLLIEGDSGTELTSYQTHRRQRVGERISIASLLSSADSTDGRVTLGKQAGRIDQAQLRVTGPDQKVATYPMFDDGRHDDGKAGDGIHGGEFMARSPGTYVAQVIVKGSNPAGQSIVRTAEHVIPVVAPMLSLTPSKALTSQSDDGRYAIDLAVASSKQGQQHYRLLAELWGRDQRGRDVAVAWLGGMADLSAGRLRLGLDERWVILAGAKGPFVLRNVRIEEPDHFITVASAKELPITLPSPRSKAAANQIMIDDAMRMGLRPSAIAPGKATGSRLLLVHGYCSGGVWPAAQFSNASTFLDANANRSHDQFARLLQTFGSSWNSFGTVAHSQGGAASLHLYTYYWSGLDNAGSGRLIQSVGTPYQGTNLSGILAALGSWFGVGCGTNDNLTYSGSAAWLAGIPSWARAKVNYYTTSFRSTNWWTNDYCNFATDLVLSDPEDGTTEKAYGQLSGAVNRGHTNGQCHTAGMRDPAQYQDASRNASMSANASR